MFGVFIRKPENTEYDLGFLVEVLINGACGFFVVILLKRIGKAISAWLDSKSTLTDEDVKEIKKLAKMSRKVTKHI